MAVMRLSFLVSFVFSSYGDRRPPQSGTMQVDAAGFSCSGNTSYEIDNVTGVYPRVKAVQSMIQKHMVNTFHGQYDFLLHPRSGAKSAQVFYSRLLFASPVFLICAACLVYAFCAPRLKHLPDSLDDDFESSDSEHEHSACADSYSAEDPIVLDHFAWASTSEIPSSLTRDSTLELDFVSPPCSTDAVRKCLATRNIDVNCWDANALEALTRELSKGRSRLFFDQKLFRVVDLVLVIFEYVPDQVVMQEVAHLHREQLLGGEIAERIPKARMQSNECLTDTVRRCLKEKIGVPQDLIQDIACIAAIEERSEFLPNLTSVVRKFITHVRLCELDDKMQQELGLQDKRLSWGGSVFAWEPIDQVRALRKYLKRKDSGMKSASTVLGHGAEPVLFWDEASVLDLLKEHRIVDVENTFGKPLPDIVSMLQKGAMSFGICRSTRRLLCVQETVSLRICSDAFTLVEDGGDTDVEPTFPCTQKWANESAWAAALRLSRARLGPLVPHLQMATCFVEEVRMSFAAEDVSGSRDLPGNVLCMFLVRAGATVAPDFAGLKVHFGQAMCLLPWSWRSSCRWSSMYSMKTIKTESMTSG